MPSSMITVILATALTVSSVNDSTPATVSPSASIVQRDAERNAKAEETRRRINERLEQLERLK